MPEYARELPSEEAGRLGATARHARPLFRNRPQTREQERRGEQIRRNKVLLRGRFQADGREVWDVVVVEGGVHRLYARGCLFVEEAAELAVQCMRGRVCVSLAGARTLLRIGGHLAEPARDVSPLSPRVTLVPVDGRPVGASKLIEVRPGAPERPRVVTVMR